MGNFSFISLLKFLFKIFWTPISILFDIHITNNVTFGPFLILALILFLVFYIVFRPYKK